MSLMCWLLLHSDRTGELDIVQETALVVLSSCVLVVF